MEFSENQLNWIEENKELIDNRSLDRIWPSLLSEDMEPLEKRQLLAGLAIILDLPMEIRKKTKSGSPQTFYPLFINGLGDRIVLVEFGCIGNPGKNYIRQETYNELRNKGIEGKMLREVMKRVEYNVD